MSDIQIKFINESNDKNNSQVVIFQKNVANSYDEILIAWKVFQLTAPSEPYPFVFPVSFEISAIDSTGNQMPLFSAKAGDAFEMTRGPSGDVLKLSNSQSAFEAEVELCNLLPLGAISACIFKDDRLLYLTKEIMPGQKAVFQFDTTICIAVLDQVSEGQEFDAAQLRQKVTEIDLLGIASADIVVVGGGTGQSAVPVQFMLQNITV